jgi:G6PDH family F420-dependent oxidoreductase
VPRYGFTLFSELNGARAMVEQAEQAEAAGFDFLGMSDHFHPWLSRHTDSPLAWTALGAVAARTEQVDLVTLVTCPFQRYHPAIVAEGAATVQELSGGRFTLGVGSGELLSEHITGQRWAPVDVRHDQLAEAIEVIRELWEGGWVTYRGEHVTVEDAKLHTLPDAPPAIAVAASGPRAIALAVEHGDGVVCDEPDPEVVERFREGKPGAPAWSQIPIAWDPDEDAGREAAHHFAFAAPGWKVMAELPNVPAFDAIADLVDDETITGLVAAGPDPAPVVERITEAVEAGYDHVSVVQVGRDRGEGFFRWWQDEVQPKLPTD